MNNCYISVKLAKKKCVSLYLLADVTDVSEFKMYVMKVNIFGFGCY